MRKKYELRKRSADYVKEAAEDYRFLKHFKNYITQVKAYTDKKELFEYGFPYYNTQAHTLEFKLDKFEDYLEQKKANFKDRVDLVMKAQTILKAKRTNGKYKGKSCVSWKIEEKDIKQEDLIVEGEFKELTNDS